MTRPLYRRGVVTADPSGDAAVVEGPAVRRTPHAAASAVVTLRCTTSSRCVAREDVASAEEHVRHFAAFALVLVAGGVFLRVLAKGLAKA